MPRPIDADALLNEINELKKSPWYNGGNGNYERLVRSDAIGVVVDLCIKQAPTLDYAPVRHGELLFVESMENDYETEIAERCSLSGRFVYRCQGVPQDNYCPNCGALMDGKE